MGTMKSYLKDFTSDGFAIIPRVLAEDQLAALRVAFGRVQAKVNDFPDAYETRYTINDSFTVDTWGVNHVFSPELYEDAFGDILEQSMIMDFARGALGEQLRFWGGHALWAPRSVRYELNWHRDFGDHDFFRSTGESTHVQFNACLLADACFRVIPGSHRRPLTSTESHEQVTKGASELPGEMVVRCEAGDVLFMNAHALHRGSCDVGIPRQTMHYSLQSFGEPTGGHSSWRFMRAPGYLDRMPPTVRELMRHSIEWDDAHPLSMAESLRRRRASREIRSHHATS